MADDPEVLATVVVDQAYRLHRDIGPGLLESAYEAILADRLRDQGCRVDRQHSIDISVHGRRYENAFRVDMIVNSSLLIELKSLERLAPVHWKQLLTYLRLMNRPLGLLINFGALSFGNCIKRVMNDAAK